MNSDKKQIARVRAVMEEARKQNEQYSWLVESLSPIDEAAPDTPKEQFTRIQEALVIKNAAVKKTRACRERASQLHSLIWRVYQQLFSQHGKALARQVWREIQRQHENYDEDGIIQEVTAQSIHWCSGYGKEQTLSRQSFDKTLSNLKKNPPF